MKTLKPVRLSPKYYEDIEKEVNRIFWEGIYSEIVDELKESKVIQNSTPSRILQAIKSGKIQYSKGVFSGTFSATVSRQLQKLGATYNKKNKTYSLPKNKIAFDLIAEIEIAKQKSINMHEKIIDSLQLENVVQAIKQSKLFQKYAATTRRIEGDWKKAAKPLGITPDFTDDILENISKNYTNDMEKYIVNWSEDNIVKLREQIQQNIYVGARADQLSKIIQKNFGVSRNKSLFLARQETSLLLAQYKKERNATVGVTKYRWSTSKDATVRSDHKRLDGTIQRYDDPPIVNLKTGARANAGEDFGCRCIDIPVVD